MPGDRARPNAALALCACVLVAFFVGCNRSTDFVPIEQGDFRWDERAWQPLPSIVREPPDRDGARTLHVRFAIPPLPYDDPAIATGSSFLVRGSVDGRVIEVDPTMPMLIPLRKEDAGKSVELELTGFRRLELGEAWIGSERQIFIRLVALDMAQFAVACTLAIGGALLLLGGLFRRGTPEYRWLGVFAFALGAMSVGQSSVYAAVIFPSHAFWTWLMVFTKLVFPIGLLRFTIAMFGDGRRRELHFASSFFAALAIVQSISYVAGFSLASAIAAATSLLLLLVFVLLLRVVWTKRAAPTARIFLGGFATLFVLALPDLVWSAGYPLFFFNTTPFAILALAASLVVAVERNYREKNSALEASRADLDTRVRDLELHRREIESLADELRHQVEVRSRELRAALAGGAAPVEIATVRALAPGDVIGDRYAVVRHIGSGAMGAVYEVERKTDEKRFALKVMTGNVTTLDAARFAREAEMAAQVRHPNLVAIVDVGIHASRAPYLVMELVLGQALDDLKPKYGDVAWALPILRDIAAGLAALHRRGIVHRDLKPANVLLEPDVDVRTTARRTSERDRAKIADFGIAREGEDAAPVSVSAQTIRSDAASLGTSPEASKLTQTGSLVGTPFYMAPEAARGQGVGIAADVFAFALVAFELLTKASPFDPPAVLQALADKPLPKVEVPLALGLDLELAAALERALAEKPEERPTAADFERILGAVVAHSTMPPPA
ncbi:MAG TPA: protein kinase [Polyangiaceae bacterium]